MQVSPIASEDYAKLREDLIDSVPHMPTKKLRDSIDRIRDEVLAYIAISLATLQKDSSSIVHFRNVFENIETMQDEIDKRK